MSTPESGLGSDMDGIAFSDYLDPHIMQADVIFNNQAVSFSAKENVAVENITAFYLDAVILPGKSNLAFLDQAILHLEFIAVQPLAIRQKDKGIIPPITGMAQRRPEFQKEIFNVHYVVMHEEMSRVYYVSFFSILLFIIEIKSSLSARLHPI